MALNPSYVASSLMEGNLEISKGLEWVRTWALHVAESDTDRECYTVRICACIFRLHLLFLHGYICLFVKLVDVSGAI